MTDSPAQPPQPPVDWEAFYQSFRKPGYVPGYEITSKLGGGMFGLVFKATKQSIGKDYAIKFLKVDDEEVRRAVVAELDSAPFFAQVDHPNLVSIEDRGVIDGIPYIVMAYAGDETLRDRMGAGSTDIESLLRLFLQACRGVQALHEHSLVHFDLKPANIFLKGDVARIGDYGLSKLVAQSRNTLSMGRGTPYYMAPEMLQRKGDARSDVYSLGVILYEILTGDVPFKGDSEWEVLRKHENASPDYPPDMPAEFRDVLSRALAKDPAGRFQSASELLTALCASAAGAPVVGASTSSETAVPPEPKAGGTDKEDPYADFRKAVQEFSEQAKQMAGEAVKSAREASRKATREARAAMGPAMRRHRRVWAARAREERRRWKDWWEMGGWRGQWQRRRSNRRRSSTVRLGMVVVGGLFALAFVGALFMAVGAPSPRGVATVEWSTASAEAEASSSWPSGMSTIGIETRSTGGQQVQADARAKSPAVLRTSLDAFRQRVPVSAADLVNLRHDVPDYELALAFPEQQLDEARQAASRYAKSKKDDRGLELRLRKQGYAGVLAAIELLGAQDVSDPAQARAARRLHLFLETQLQFRAIVMDLSRVGQPDDEYADLNAMAPQLWRWFVHDFARDERSYQAYRRSLR